MEWGEGSRRSGVSPDPAESGETPDPRDALPYPVHPEVSISPDRAP